MPTRPIVLGQINLVVRDMNASLAFYQRLGLAVEPASHPDWAQHHASAQLPNGMSLELDSVAFAKQWTPGLRESAERGRGAVIFFRVATRADVDRVHAEMTAAGYASQKDPEDAFWGARYAIMEDPDGNPIGVTTAIDQAQRRAPPNAPQG